MKFFPIGVTETTLPTAEFEIQESHESVKIRDMSDFEKSYLCSIKQTNIRGGRREVLYLKKTLSSRCFIKQKTLIVNVTEF